MSDLTIPLNDKGYYLNFTVQDSTGAAYNLTDYTITLKVWAAGSSGTLIASGACAIVVAASGTCRYTITSTDFTVKGIYSAELELTKTGVIESTTAFTIEVKESG